MTAEDRARRVEMLLMDVDGTLTDGTILILPDGEELRSYHVADGLGILLAQLAGLRVGIITGKESRSVATRAKRLRLAEVTQGAIDKKKALDEILARHELAAEKVAYIGDDLGDLSVLRTAGLAGAVGDAHPDVKSSAHYVCRTAGGRGAVREFIEFILKAQGTWDDVKTRVHELKSFRI
ncbi:MAG: HAD hydrolase family protein [Candidatus Aminicenantes bacterium]|nr:HAD hydrolase family protein [Candidatus Aminicenantes bacterium]